MDTHKTEAVQVQDARVCEKSAAVVGLNSPKVDASSPHETSPELMVKANRWTLAAERV
jgi:hypothetical protein